MTRRARASSVGVVERRGGAASGQEASFEEVERDVAGVCDRGACPAVKVIICSTACDARDRFAAGARTQGGATARATCRHAALRAIGGIARGGSCQSTRRERQRLADVIMALWPGVHRSRALRLALSLFHGSMLPPTSCRSLHRSAHRARGGRILVERNGQWVYLPRSILNEDRHAVPRRRPPRTTEADAVPATSQATVAPEPTTSRTVTATTAAERLKKVLRAEPEVKTFEGVEVPARPLAPASDQCCMSGAHACKPCL
jgi:hypothetical protein